MRSNFPKKDKELADLYIDVLSGKEKDVGDDDAVAHLRESLQSVKMHGKNYSPKNILGLCIKAWNHWRDDRPCKQLRFKATGVQAEDIPEIK